MTEEKIYCCGKEVEWEFITTDIDGVWYEQTCQNCGHKISLKCELSKESLKALTGDDPPS